MNMHKHFLRLWTIFPFLLLIGGILGCGGSGRPEAPLPKLYPVQGQLVRAGQPVPGGSLRFEPVAAASSTGSSAASLQNVSVAGTVGPDGRFELVTLQTLSLKSASGAPAGQYRVTYYPPPSENPEAQAAKQPITLPQLVTIHEGQNQLTLSLDRPSSAKGQ